jgi:hypothetical protein
MQYAILFPAVCIKIKFSISLQFHGAFGYIRHGTKVGHFWETKID